MPYEADESFEVAHELIREEIDKSHNESWVAHVALSTMIMALFAALSGLLAGITANDLVVERTHEILIVERLEADRLDVEILKSKHDILTAMGHLPSEVELERIREFEAKIPELTREAELDESNVKHTLHQHEMFAIAVTLLSLGITLSGIALISRRQFFWGLGIAIGLGGPLLMVISGFEMLTI